MKQPLVIIMLLFAAVCKGQSVPPPSSFDILKWFSNNSFPKTHNGWEVEFKDGWSFTGYTEGTCFYKVNVTCDTCGYLQKYTDDIVLSYGYKDGTTVNIVQNEDTTNKYMSIEYGVPFGGNKMQDNSTSK